VRKDFVVCVLAGFVLAALAYFTTQGSEYREGVHAVSQCVSDHWVEYEDRTGRMPSVELEKDWHKSCSILVRSR